MYKRSIVFTLIVLLMLVLAACGGDDGGDAETASGGGDANPARGEELYKQTVIGSASAPGCVTCHSLEADMVLVGPSHVGIATKADTSGLDIEEYLRQSIEEPDAIISEGFTEGVMYQNYATDLTEQQISDLVAFLLTLK